MPPPTAIVGLAQTRHGDLSEKSFDELVFEVCSGALKDAGLSHGDIDLVVASGIDLLDGKGISNGSLVGVEAARLKEETKAEEDGAVAFGMADQRLRSGKFEAALVYSYAKGTCVDLDSYSTLLFEPALQRPLGLNETITLALQAESYARTRGMTPEDAAQVREHARSKQKAGHVAPGEPAEPGVTPFVKGDLPPPTDGAAAVVLVRGERAREFGKPVYVAGFGAAVDAYNFTDRDPSRIGAARLAAERAYQKAGVQSPAREIQVAELSAPSSYHLPMLMEALGLCENGAEALREGFLDGRVNPSGGQLLADPRIATGLVRICEAALQLRGEAVGRQCKDVRLAVAHGACGLALQSNTVALLSAGPRGGAA